MNKSALHVDNVTVRFGGVKALDHVSLTVQQGTLHGLIGPNGAGKSTLFKCLTGQIRPTSGEVFIHGEDVTQHQTYDIALHGVGIKTQIPSLMDDLTVREHLWLACRRYVTSHQANERADMLIDKLEFNAIATSPLGQLAHGERQLIEFSMIMAQEPKLALLDEPAAGLGDEDTERLAYLIKEMNASATVIVVEHDMHFIRNVANQVTVLHQGKTLMQDSVNIVLSNPTVQRVYLGEAI